MIAEKTKGRIFMVVSETSPLTATCRTIKMEDLDTAGLPAPEPIAPDQGAPL